MSMFMTVVLETGEIPESVAGGPGVAKSLAVNFDDLNAMARDLGLKPLGEFYVDYAEGLEALWADESLSPEEMEAAASRVGSEGPWFDPDEALKTVRGLLGYVELGPADSGAGLRTVLNSVAAGLDFAKDQGSRFHFAFQE